MEYNPSRLPNWKHCQRCGRLYKGFWEVLCGDCRKGKYGYDQNHEVKSKQDSDDVLKDIKRPDDFPAK